MESVSGTNHSQSESTFSSSSMTGSSNQADDEEQPHEVDFEKDNSVSPVDLECHIQAERLTKILDEALYKTKLAACIPYLVHEYRPLKDVLKSQQFTDLIFIFEQYENPLFTTSLLNISGIDDIKAGDLSLKTRLNPELGHLMCILAGCPTLKPVVEARISLMKKQYQKNELKNKLDIRSVEYILKLEQFRDLMVVRMDMTAEEELSTKFDTRKLEESNRKLLEFIKEFGDALKKEWDEFEELMAKKQALIRKLEQELVFIHHEASTKLKKKILDSDRQMVLMSRAHVVKSEILTEEQAEMEVGYRNVLKDHVALEKKQRARRCKVETQLQSWLQKYDTEMADKQVELDDYTLKYEEECEKCIALEEKVAEQDIEYIPLMEEREAEYHQELTEKMNKCRLEHAARVIQTAWLQVLANRKEKKLLKKKIKKMLKEKEAAEKKAPKKKA